MATVTAKASRASYLAFAAIWGIPMLVGLVASFRNPAGFWVVGIVALAFGTTWLWLSVYSVEVSADEVRCRSFFRGRRTLRRENIRRATLRTGHESVQDALKPQCRLEIEAVSNGALIITSINLKVLSREDSRALLEALGVPHKRFMESTEPGLAKRG